MTLKELESKLSNVEAPGTLVEKMRNAESEEAALQILKDHGIEITAKEMENLFCGAEELDANELDLVAGGCDCGWGRKFVAWCFNVILGLLGTDVRVECC